MSAWEIDRAEALKKDSSQKKNLPKSSKQLKKWTPTNDDFDKEKKGEKARKHIKEVALLQHTISTFNPSPLNQSWQPFRAPSFTEKTGIFPGPSKKRAFPS